MPAVAIENNKGGVGKSTLCAALAAAHARKRRRVLCVDMDPQANLSRRLGFHDNLTAPVPTLAEAIRANDQGCAADIVIPCQWDDPTAEQIDLLPSRFDLENRISEAGTVGASLRLANVMVGLVELYDWVLIDCPPSLGQLTQMAMVAAGQDKDGYVLIVANPEFDAMTGAVRVRDFVRQYAAALGVPNLGIGGVIINGVRRTDLHASNMVEINEAFGPLVWEPHVPLWTAMADAMNSAVPVHSLPGQKAAELTERLDALADRMALAS